MSDFGRKPVSDKIAEKVTPESEKSTLDQAKQTISGGVDKAVAGATPDNQKSFTQTISDNVQQGHDDAKKAVNQEPTLAETAAEYVDLAKKEVAGAAAYVSEVITGATEGAKTADADAKK